MLRCITEVKNKKANDMNGNTPGIVKNLPPALFLFIFQLLNAISFGTQLTGKGKCHLMKVRKHHQQTILKCILKISSSTAIWLV